MTRVIDLFQELFNNDEESTFTEVENAIVEKTKSLFKTVIFSTVGFFICLGVGIVINVNYHEKALNAMVNAGFLGLFLLIILVISLFARYIFRVTISGVAYGVAKSGESGLEGGGRFLKYWLKTSVISALVVVVTFGVLIFGNFTWFSAGFCFLGSIFIALFTAYQKLSQ